jgi:hypothetical protein
MFVWKYDPGVAVSPSESDLAKFPGLDRLEALTRASYGEGLTGRTIDLLRAELFRAFGQEVDTDRLDEIPISDVATILERFRARRGGEPSAGTGGTVVSNCPRCGRPLEEVDRAWMSGLCGDCRTGRGTMLELDVAVRTRQPNSVDRRGGDRLDRFPDWVRFKTFIFGKFGKFLIDKEIWNDFSKWFECNYSKNHDEFLSMKRDVVLRLLEVPPTFPPADPPPPGDAGSALYLTPGQAARLIGCDESFVSKLGKSGKLKTDGGPGRGVRYELPSVRQFAEEFASRKTQARSPRKKRP